MVATSQRMHQVGLARLARLALVMLQGKFVGFFDEGEIVVGPVGADLAQQIAKAGDRQNIGRDLLAQSRHNRLYAPAREAALPLKVFERQSMRYILTD